MASGGFGIVHMGQLMPKTRSVGQPMPKTRSFTSNKFMEKIDEDKVMGGSDDASMSTSSPPDFPPLYMSGSSGEEMELDPAVDNEFSGEMAPEALSRGAHYQPPLGAGTESSQPLLAIKCLSLQLKMNREEMEHWKHIQTAAGKSHPNILKLLYSFTNVSQTAVYLVSPWIPKTLAHLIWEGTTIFGKWLKKISVERGSEIARDMLCGLEHMHSPEVSTMHRDIKPENILIRRNGTAVLADMGLCQRFRDTERPDKQLAWLIEKYVGTVLYASPQQVGLRYVAKDDKGNPIMQYHPDGTPVMRKPHGSSELVHAEVELNTEEELRDQLRRLNQAPPGEGFVFQPNAKGVKYTSTVDVYQAGATILEAIRGEPLYKWEGDKEKTREAIKLNQLNMDGEKIEMIEHGKIIEETPRQTQGRATLFNMTRYVSARPTAHKVCELLDHAGLRRDVDIASEGLSVLPAFSNAAGGSVVAGTHAPRAQTAEVDSSMRAEIIFAIREEGEDFDQSDETIDALTAQYAKSMTVAEPGLGYKRLPDGTRDARHPSALEENGGQVVGPIAKQLRELRATQEAAVTTQAKPTADTHQPVKRVRLLTGITSCFCPTRNHVCQ